MARRRQNDPAGVCDNPNVVSDAGREAELAAEFVRKVRYLMRSYELAKRLRLDKNSFNASLAKLKRGVRRPHDPDTSRSCLNPWIQVAINMRARELAELPQAKRLGPEHSRFVQQAAVEVAKRAKGIRGVAGQDLLRRYVEALMALIQETTGTPLLAIRDKDYFYDPQLLGKSGEAMRLIIGMLEPAVGEKTLANWVLEIRRKRAGKPMRFLDYCPGYGMT